jgi:maleate cis-trans isomerase
VEAASAIEARTGRPVVSSNQSTIWAALRALGLTRPITGFGRLLERLVPSGPVAAGSPARG